MVMEAILQNLMPVVAALGTAILLAFVNRGLNILDKKLGLEVSQDQREIIQHTLDTAAGAIQLAIQHGRLTPGEVRWNHPVVQSVVTDAFHNVRDSQHALTITDEHAVRMSAARWVNTHIVEPPCVQTLT